MSATTTENPPATMETTTSVGTFSRGPEVGVLHPVLNGGECGGLGRSGGADVVVDLNEFSLGSHKRRSSLR